MMREHALPKAVLFDLLTGLLDSWSLWNSVAGSEAKGRAWRAEYLRLTYGCGPYRPYEELVREAADATGIATDATETLMSRWDELSPWSDAQRLLDRLQGVAKLAVVTNCSERLGLRAAARLRTRWDCIVTAERAATTSLIRVLICSRSRFSARPRRVPCSWQVRDTT